MPSKKSKSPAPIRRWVSGRTLLSAVALHFLLILGFDKTASAAAPTATVEQGTLTGIENAGVLEFLGVRYAEAPVGDLRWQPPKPVSHGRGRIDATQFGANCPQGASPWGTPSTTEDCLFLNVYAPAGIDPDRWREGKGELPVMVWIHGGGFTAGAGSFYDPTPMVTAGNIIVVTINYRLGALGLFAQTALDAEHHLIGNYALMDQQLAFKWVRRNIQAFGGNPDDVTISNEVELATLSWYAHHLAARCRPVQPRHHRERSAPATSRCGSPRALGTRLRRRSVAPPEAINEVAACLRAVPASQPVANQATPTGAIVDGQHNAQATRSRTRRRRIPARFGPGWDKS